MTRFIGRIVAIAASIIRSLHYEECSDLARARFDEYSELARCAMSVSSSDPARRILDVGTGPGILLTALSGLCERSALMGLDISPAFAKIARDELRSVDGDLVLADVHSMPLRGDSFDLIVSSNSLHHWKDPSRVFRGIERVPKPRAGAVISDYRRGLTAIQMKDLEASYLWSLRGMLRESVRKSILKDEVNCLVDDLSFERRKVSDHAKGLRVMLANRQIR